MIINKARLSSQCCRLWFLLGPPILPWPFGWSVWLLCRIRVSKPMADSRPKGPQLWLRHPSGGRAAFQTPMHPLYSTRPNGLVQAIFWYTCPDLDLGPGSCLTHWTYIAFSGSMTSRDQVSARSRHSPPPLSPLKSAFGLLTLCQVLSGGKAAVNTFSWSF